jgi:quinol monooxygenase YgiN
MIIEYIRYRIPEPQTTEFLQAYKQAQHALQASPHCLRYELSRCLEEPARHVLRIEWDSVEGHLQGFRRSEQFRVFLGHVRPFVDQIEEMQHYERLSLAEGDLVKEAP